MGKSTLHNATKTRQVIRRKEVDTFPESHTLGNINKGLNINFVTLPLTMAKTFQVSSTICVLMCALYTAYAQNVTTTGAPTGNTNVTAQVNVTAQPIVNVTAQVNVTQPMVNVTTQPKGNVTTQPMVNVTAQVKATQAMETTPSTEKGSSATKEFKSFTFLFISVAVGTAMTFLSTSVLNTY